MKNKTIEQMYRNEFNLSDDIQVNVELLMSSSSNCYEYSVEWYDFENHQACQSLVKLPHKLPFEVMH